MATTAPDAGNPGPLAVPDHVRTNRITSKPRWLDTLMPPIRLWWRTLAVAPSGTQNAMRHSCSDEDTGNATRKLTYPDEDCDRIQRTTVVPNVDTPLCGVPTCPASLSSTRAVSPDGPDSSIAQPGTPTTFSRPVSPATPCLAGSVSTHRITWRSLAAIRAETYREGVLNSSWIPVGTARGELRGVPAPVQPRRTTARTQDSARRADCNCRAMTRWLH